MKEIIARAKDGISLNLYIQPGASQTGFAGVYNDRLKVRVQARAIEGAANKSVCDFISQQFHVTKSSVILMKGARSREKQVFINGDAETLAQTAQGLIDQ